MSTVVDNKLCGSCGSIVLNGDKVLCCEACQTSKMVPY